MRCWKTRFFLEIWNRIIQGEKRRLDHETNSKGATTTGKGMYGGGDLSTGWSVIRHCHAPVGVVAVGTGERCEKGHKDGCPTLALMFG